jgi:hypothetical protein
MADYGPAKSIADITHEELQAHPIWLWCMALGLPDEDDGPMGGDETWMRPLLDSTNVTAEMWQPFILSRIKGTDYFAAGLYDHKKRKLESIGIQTKTSDEPTALTRVGGVRVPVGWSAPLTFVAVPTIEGGAGVAFRCESLDKDEAEMVS